MKLKEDIFALELFKGISQRKSYRKAFPHSQKWKDSSVDVKASILAKSDKIEQRLIELRDRQMKRTDITADIVINEIAVIALLKEADFYHENGTVKLLSELSKEQRAGLIFYRIKTIQVEGKSIEIPEFRVHDKLKALEMLGKHFALFTDIHKVEMEIKVKLGLKDFYK